MTKVKQQSDSLQRTDNKRKKKVLPGTATLERRYGENYAQIPSVSNKKVGQGRYNNGSFLSFFLNDEKKYIDKKTGKKVSAKEAELKRRIKGFREENYEPWHPSQVIKKYTKRR